MATIFVAPVRTRLAQGLETCFTPPVVPLVVGVAVCWNETWPRPEGLLWALGGIGSWLTLCLAAAFCAVRLGWWPELMPTRRGHRVALLVMVTVLSAVVWLGCAYGGAPPRLLAFGAAGPLLVVLVLLGTCATNVSLHTSAAAAGVTQLTLLLDPRCVVLYGVVAAIAWSRLYLGAHTRGQVLAGAALGVAACAALAEFTR